MGAAVQALLFNQANATASQSAVAIPVVGDATINEVVMPWAGAVVGISVTVENARTAGTLTVDATINGTATGHQAIVNATNTQYAYNAQSKDANQFSAGQRIGVKVTTDGSWAAGTTPSITAVVWVQKGLSET